MRWFYGRVALILFILLITIGTYYIHAILKSYSHSHSEVYISWAILCIINSYSLYTLYYDSLLQGQGLVTKARQIQIIGQVVYLLVAIVMIVLQFNLIAIVSAQALSVIIRRFLSYQTIYTTQFKQHLHNVVAQSRKNILKMIYPNAVKVGLTSLGSFLVARSSILIGSLHLSLETIASYGITIQIITIIAGLSTVYFSAYYPRIVQLRAQNNIFEIKRIYLKTCLLLFGTYLVCGAGMLCFGDWLLNLIGSQTPLLHKSVIALVLVAMLLESNHAVAGAVLLTKNEVPFFRASLFAGAVTVSLLFIFLNYTQVGVWGLVLAPAIAQVCYQNWRWPMVVIKELNYKSRQ
jgi:O-antigen/teichoic acid export membrane protein